MRNKKNEVSLIQKVLAQISIFIFILLTSIPVLAADGATGKPWYTGIAPIAMLLAVIAFVLWRLPEVKEDPKKPGELAHLKDKKYRRRRSINWLVLGVMYAFLYWGRYNLNGAIINLGGKEMLETFNWVFGAGTITYGVSFLLNGPLTDRFGGRFSILVGVFGAAVANLAMGIACWLSLTGEITANQLFWSLIVIYPVNMYFQSFGAVAIVKCNSAWFHVRERGVFGAIFGILIAMGIYFAFDWTSQILDTWKLPVNWAFFAPAAALGIMFVVGYLIVRNKPSEAGYRDIKTGDTTSGESGPSDPPLQVFKEMFNYKDKETGIRVIMFIACIEFCSGFLRQAIMQIYRPFAKAIGATDSFVYHNWGLLLCCGGILGGVFAGTISDHFFKARRGPVAAILYVGMFLGSVGLCFLLGSPYLAWVVVFMSMFVIGIHGMLSGTASMDFGGSRNAGIAVGMIDGFVYAGTGLQAVLYALTLPESGSEAAKDPSAWWFWPMAMIPFAVIGLILAYKIRKCKPKPRSDAACKA